MKTTAFSVLQWRLWVKQKEVGKCQKCLFSSPALPSGVECGEDAQHKFLSLVLLENGVLGHDTTIKVLATIVVIHMVVSHLVQEGVSLRCCSAVNQVSTSEEEFTGVSHVRTPRRNAT
jgi:hypothetical protein